ncbi:MAG: Ig-like domain-containing protein [bacterium]
MKTQVKNCYFLITKNIIIITLTFAAILLNCAEIASPPGGEEDKKKPFLISSEPPNGEVNVPLGNRIILSFSERVIKTSGRSIFISPRPLDEPKIKWKNEQVEIIFADSFQANETYIISLSSGITDLRKNNLDSAGIIAFSTGPTLDTGIISGTVYQDSKPRGGLVVALYDQSLVSDSTVYDNLYPSYYTQSNSEGQFKFEYLPSKEFRLIAFEDKNKDEFFNPERESFALTDRPIKVGGNINIDNLSLSLSSQDTTKPGIISASFTSENLLKIRLTKPIEVKNIAGNPKLATIVLLNDSSVSYSAQSLFEDDDKPASNLNLYFGILDEGTYNIDLIYDTTKPALKYENIILKKTEDKTPPSVISFQPEKSPVLTDSLKIKLKFSEPLNRESIKNSTFKISKGSDTLQSVQADWLDDFRIKINSPEFSAGESYKLIVTDFELMDQAGNVVGDSLREYTFSTIDSNTLGSISGEVNVQIPQKENDPVILTLTNIDKKTDYKLKVTNHNFKLDVLSGSYIMVAHVDSDNNNEFANGSIKPFRYAETIANFPDTIKVRARFETTGIIFDIK